MQSYYRVQDFVGSSPMLVKSSLKLKELLYNIITYTEHKEGTFSIYYHWRQLNFKEEQNDTLEQIVKKQIVKESQSSKKNIKKSSLSTTHSETLFQSPVFYICDDIIQDHNVNEQYKEIYQQLKQHLYVDENQKKAYWHGSNGNMVLDQRNLALLASSLKKNQGNSKFKQQFKVANHQDIKRSLIQQQPQKKQQQEIGLIRKLLQKLGILKEKPTNENIYQTLAKLKKIQTQEDIKKLKIDNRYSNFDTKFATYLESVYLKFAIKSSFKMHYVQYKSWDFGVIKKRFRKDAKIGIIGDFGTGLSDSIKLLEDMINQKKVDIILHLGDVYYAGTPQEYSDNIIIPLNQIRCKAKREILFYSIPGNHDYYSWGLPYLCFLKEVNDDEFVKQEASYFCLRCEDDTWQFLGVDTAFHDSDPMDQLSPTSLGPRIRHKQLSWHRQKLQNFVGSTILLTHHQLFSIHDRICGSLSSYRKYSCVNPLISSQLFEYSPYFSCWFWGHQHAFMLFGDDILGASRCRLLGNSSFHVIFEKQHPYQRKQHFPHLPFILSDKQYYQKYLPVDPNTTQIYFNLCYGVFDMSKKTNEGLPIQYYCCPSFQEKDKDKPHFKPYKLYEQILPSREYLLEKYKSITNESVVYIKMQTGLLVNYQQDHMNMCQVKNKQKCLEKNQIGFSIAGKPFLIQFHQHQYLQDGSIIYLKALKANKQFFYLQLNPKNNKIYLTPLKTDNAKWKIKKLYIMHDLSPQIKYRNTFKLEHTSNLVYMSWRMDQGIVLGGKGKIGEAVWMFLEKSIVGWDQGQIQQK